MISKKFLFIFFLLYMAIGSSGLSQVYISGQTDIVVRNASAIDYSNKTFAWFSNFNFIRSRLFFDAQPGEDITVFTQILMDNGEFNLYGAYLRLSGFPAENVNIHVGLIPNTVGTWGPRTYSNKNPLIGVPLLYNYHTSLRTRTVQTPEMIFNARGTGAIIRGAPLLYDTCWNGGIEFFGSYGILDWSVAALSGSVSAPRLQPRKDLPQLTAKAGFFFSPEFNLTLSAFSGPYFDQYDEAGEKAVSFDVEDYLNSGTGISVNYAHGYLQFNSEAFFAEWEHPNVENLEMSGAYGEVKYKLAPQWYAALRGDILRFSKVVLGESVKTTWDYPVNRVEAGIGYNLNRALIIKLVTQITDVLDSERYDDRITAVQFAVSY